MDKVINFDMDGTIAGFYDVENWLDYLNKESTHPYRVAKPMADMRMLARNIHKLQKKGYKVNIISWTSKCGSADYNAKVAETKKKWLKQHLGSVTFDNIYIVDYGTPKSTCASGILFDDEVNNRKEWRKSGGIAHSPNDINRALMKLK